MSSTYAKFIAEAAYKHTLDKPNTSYNMAWYEEAGRTAHRVDIDSIWVDSLYIPTTAPEVDDDGFYRATINNEKIKILQKCENIALDKVKGTKYTYYSPYLIDSIIPSYGSGYEAKLTDWNGVEIPFGLNQWVIDPDSGYLTFMLGWPEGYQETPRLSFFKYVGRKANETMLLSSGIVPMDDNYNPVNDKDIATKDYVDKTVSPTDSTLQKLIPTKPANISNVDLTLDCDYIMASPWNSTTEIPLIFYDDDWKIRIPPFYHPGNGNLSIIVNNVELLTIDLNTVSGPDIKSNIYYIESVYDPYSADIIAKNFYSVIKSYINIPKNILDTFTSDKVPYITVYVKQTYNFTTYISNSITIGFEKRVNLPNISNINLSELKNDKDSIIKYISGVPSLNENTVLCFSYSINDINFYKSNLISKYTTDFFGKIIESDDTYDKAYPIHRVKENLRIENNVYTEKLNLTIYGNNVEKNYNISTNRSYNIRIDTVSDESNRIISPEKFNSDFSLEKWTSSKAAQNLNKSNELQMLDGYYQWPTGNYTDIGNFEAYKVTDTFTISLNAGPDYSNITEGIRYVSFAYDMPLCNGFWISIENPKSISNNYSTKAYILPVFKCMVKNETGWLDMNLPYEGVLSPRESGEGCLISSLSTLDKKYITFGNEPLEGTLFIVIGIRKSSIKFSGINIVFNS